MKASKPWQELAQTLHREERRRHHARVRKRSIRTAATGASVVVLCLAFIWVLSRLT